MKADRDEFIARMKQLDRDALAGITISLYDELSGLRLNQLENERINSRLRSQDGRVPRPAVSRTRASKGTPEKRVGRGNAAGR